MMPMTAFQSHAFMLVIVLIVAGLVFVMHETIRTSNQAADTRDDVDALMAREASTETTPIPAIAPVPDELATVTPISAARSHVPAPRRRAVAARPALRLATEQDAPAPTALYDWASQGV